MNRTRIRTTMFAALVAFGATLANAEEFANLGELLDKGAKRLDAAELKALLTGATARGTTFGGKLDVETTFESDGKASGRTWGGYPDVSPFYRGTWTINEKGQICVDLIMSDPRVPPAKGCSFYFILNNNAYYIAASDDRSAVVRSRKITR
jgi:hypothetical protein